MNAQSGKLFFEFNYNTFAHTSLKNFQEEFKNDLGEIPIQTTDDFPGNFGFSLGYELVDKNVLIFASYNSTGGKLSYSDYSGLIRITEELKGYTLGVEYLIPLSETDNYFTLGLRGFGMFTTMNLENYYQISESVSQDGLEFQSANLGLGARVLYEYPISFFIIRASIGFDLTFGGSLTFKENSDFHLEDNNGKKVKTNWTGLRTGIGFAIPF
ncbi:hypothetical protein PXD56_01405 [Maribacter sp. SA7]|uniref:hypothetical protein n=1 Tax=Maribacter zhoushanensis TaxID=3030012 RepID=UPI0023EB4FE9|nr:hypothetical protein [Maribacter zhoushanensis]MDF4201591.1 hypothetical protein [Maribacter zhoushanensis]